MPVGILKALVFVLSLLPLAYYGWGAWHDTLGANPIETITRGMGTWTLNFLLITLAVTPLRKLTGWHAALRLRRMLGLFTFFYAVLHLTSYLWFDQFFDWGEIAQDILKRPFITVGMAAFMLLVPLAATSSNWAIRRLGGRRWQTLHRTVYVIGILAVLHYSWLVKADQSQPLLYGGILVVLLGLRAWWREVERRAQLAGKYQPRIRNRIIPIQPRR
jgi:methionine sulfoxide reductase heme-binding subunit